jgi:hypothetical protein
LLQEEWPCPVQQHDYGPEKQHAAFKHLKQEEKDMCDAHIYTYIFKQNSNTTYHHGKSFMNTTKYCLFSTELT